MKQCLYCYSTFQSQQYNALYCKESCGHKYRKKDTDPIIGKGRCKYCKDPNHEGYCCDDHKRIYTQIIKDIKIAKSKPKRKPTEEQLKGYAKIETFLNRPL